MMRTLHPHQEKAIDLLRQSLGSGKRRPMLQAPTGFGKTVLAGAIVAGALKKGKRVVFCVPALSLIDQTVESFWQEGIRDIGVIQGAHEMTNWSRPIQVCSVQTLQKRQLPHADVVMIDEAHRWFDFYGQWMGDPAWAKVPFIGLSATPWTRGLGKFYDDLLIAATTKDLIAGEFLSPFRVFAPSHPDLAKVRTVAGDYHEGDLAEEMGKPQLVADVVETWLEKGESRSTLCFGVDRAHAKQIEVAFAAAGVRTAYIDAFTDREERNRIAEDFHSGEVKVVCNIGCLTTGVDWDVRCIILARPTKSEMLFTQIVGRGLRTAEGKQDCLLLDHSDTHLRLGFVTDIHHTELDAGKPPQSRESERKTPLPKECNACHFLKPAKVHKCPSCGFAPEREASVECVGGELHELGVDTPKKRKKGEYTPMQKLQWFAMLRGYAKEKGKSESWVLANYREKFKEWPARKTDVLPMTPSLEVASWIRSRRIAFAKAREKEKGGQDVRAA